MDMTEYKTGAIMQPGYIPWIGFFDLIDQVDLFIFLDNVQLVRRSWNVRNRIKTSQGELYLTIPVRKSMERSKTMLCNAQIDRDNKWQKKHLKSIEHAYKKSMHFDEVYPFLKGLIESEKNTLSEFNINIIREISFKIGIKKVFLSVSELENISGKKDGLLVSICKETGINEYVSARGSSEYIEKETPGGEFYRHGINLSYHNFTHPVYNQLFGEFLSHMSIVDLLMNAGMEESLEIIRNGRGESIDCQTFRKNILNLKD